jgi:outer membrane protein
MRWSIAAVMRRHAAERVAGLALGAIALALAAAAWVGPLSAASPPDSLSLEDAIRLTLETHPAIEAAAQAIAAAEARTDASRSLLYPDLALISAYTRIQPVAEIDMPGGAMKLAPENNYDARLAVRHTVYDFGRTRAGMAVAGAGVAAAEDHLDEVRSGLAYRTIGVFNAILILRESVTVIDDQVLALKEHLEASRRKVQAGTATDFDVLTTQVRIAAASAERIDAAANLETQEIALRELTDLPPGTPVRLRGDFVIGERAFRPESLAEAAYARRPEMVMARDAETTAALQVRQTSLGDRPSVTLSATSGLKTGYPDNLDLLKPNYAAGIQLQVPVWNGNRVRSQRREAEAALRAAQARTDALRRGIATEVEQAVARASASWERIRSAQVLVEQAAQAVAMARAKYSAGVATNLDVLDAQTTLTQARLALLRSAYAYSVSLVEVDRATGARMW